MTFQDYLSAVALSVAALAILVTVGVYLLQTRQAQRTTLAIFSTIEQIYQRTLGRREAEELAIDLGADLWRSNASPKFIGTSEEVEIHLTASVGHTPNYDQLECVVESPQFVVSSLRMTTDPCKEWHDVTVRYPVDFPDEASSSEPGRYDIAWYAYDAFDGEKHKVATDSFFVLLR